MPMDHIRIAPCKGIQDSLGFWILTMDSGLEELDSLFVELVFWIQMVSGTPDSFSCVPDSVAQDSGLHNS